MGLDITAYGRLVKISEEEIEFGNYGLPINERIKSFFSNPEFPYHISGINPNDFYICKGEKFGFRAGSYAGFNEWKNQLAQLGGYLNRQDVWNRKKMGPFVELINFSDSDGTIGYMIASKLAKDFKSYEGKAKENLTPFFYANYQNWKKCCEIAAKGGAISFQ